jgi:hypothetical protein
MRCIVIHSMGDDLEGRRGGRGDHLVQQERNLARGLVRVVKHACNRLWPGIQAWESSQWDLFRLCVGLDGQVLAAWGHVSLVLVLTCKHVVCGSMMLHSACPGTSRSLLKYVLRMAAT